MLLGMRFGVEQGSAVDKRESDMDAAHAEIGGDQRGQLGLGDGTCELDVESAHDRATHGKGGGTAEKSRHTGAVCAVDGRLVFTDRLASEASVGRGWQFPSPSVMAVQ